MDKSRRKTSRTRRRTIRSLAIEELHERLDRALAKLLLASHRVERLRKAIDRKEKPIRKIAEAIAPPEKPKQFIVQTMSGQTLYMSADQIESFFPLPEKG